MKTPSVDLALRAVLISGSFVALFYPDDNVAAAAAAVMLAATIAGVVRHRRVAPGKMLMEPAPAI